MKKPRVISREVKLAALARMEAGENVSELARELKVRRKLLLHVEGPVPARRGGGIARTRSPPGGVLALAHAYALMTNHVHLLVTPADAGSLPYVMQCLGRRYVR